MTDERLTPRRRWGLRAVSVLVILAAWESYARLPGVFLLAPPTEVLGVLVTDLAIERSLLWALLAALRNAVAGYALAVAVGVPLGVLIALWQPARDVLDPVLDALHATPLVALAPVILIWFGLTSAAKVFLVFVFAVFVVTINTRAGVSDVPSGLTDAARVFGADGTTLYGEVYLRYALPQVLTGLRLGAGRAVRGMVAAELFLFADDLGTYLIDSGATFDIARLFAGVASLSILGVLAVGAIALVEARIA